LEHFYYIATMKDGFFDILSTPLQQDVNLLPRRQQLEWVGKKVLVVIGPRRSGKSSLLNREIANLLAQGVAESNIVAVNLEDERLQWNNTTLDELLQVRAQLYPEIAINDTWFFLDEVQNAPDWEKFVRRLHDTTGTHIAITGSNSKMLATEVATALRGRGYPLEILPLSFAEYLSFNNIPPITRGVKKATVMAAFEKYLVCGGFPETATLSVTQGRNILQNYYNTMVFRDVVERYKVSQFYPLKYMLARVAATIGKTVSLRKIGNELRTQGYKVGNELLYDLADMAEAGYFFKRIAKFDYSLAKREMSDKKAYFIDTGMINAIIPVSAGNKGMLFENLVFWELYRKYGNLYTTDIYYYKDPSFECDFVLYQEGGTPLPVQACYSLALPETRTREMKGLIKACETCRVATGWLITNEEEGEEQINDITISIKPAWKWMLEKLEL
jgi:predicted AAA+ superfamily ATPase